MLEFIRGIVRPALALSGFGSLVYAMLQGINVPDWYQVMVGGIVGYWFASRGNKPANGNGEPKP